MNKYTYASRDRWIDHRIGRPTDRPASRQTDGLEEWINFETMSGMYRVCDARCSVAITIGFYFIFRRLEWEREKQTSRNFEVSAIVQNGKLMQIRARVRYTLLADGYI